MEIYFICFNSYILTSNHIHNTRTIVLMVALFQKTCSLNDTNRIDVRCLKRVLELNDSVKLDALSLNLLLISFQTHFVDPTKIKMLFTK